MPELSFDIVGAEAGARGLTPMVVFKLRITSSTPEERVESVILRTQIQIEPGRRSYRSDEKERLGEIFGSADRWGQTLRNKLWALVDISVPPFTGSTEVRLPVACTYDLNVLSAKYLDALQGGDVPLLFLFSGTVFHPGPDGRLQVFQISWEKECAYLMPVETWKRLMREMYSDTQWVSLQRDVFDRLYALRRERGLQTWDATIEHLLSRVEIAEGSVT
jgi:hypothetical protein